MAEIFDFTNIGDPDFIMRFVFPILSFIISLIVAFSFFLSVKFKEDKHQKLIKHIINNNVEQLTKICDRIFVDVDDLQGNTEADVTKAQQLTAYFERNITRLEMIRINIENQLAHIQDQNDYVKKIKDVLKMEDSIIEMCNRPDIPSKYQLSLWKEHQIDLQEKTSGVIKIAKDLKIIHTPTH